MKKRNAFEKLEEKLNMANTIIEELTDDEPEIVNLPMEINDNIDEVFSLGTLKQDFILIRQNLLSLVTKGQRLLDSCSVLDMTELKASQIEAISNLNATIANNLKLMMSIYKDISDIEQQRVKSKFAMGDNVVQSVNTGTVNNIVFQGSTDQLMKLINETKL